MQLNFEVIILIEELKIQLYIFELLSYILFEYNKL